jgi:hypothetical protein
LFPTSNPIFTCAGSLLTVRTSGGFAGRATGDAPPTPPNEPAIDRLPRDVPALGLSPYAGGFRGVPGDALVAGDDAAAA